MGPLLLSLPLLLGGHTQQPAGNPALPATSTADRRLWEEPQEVGGRWVFAFSPLADLWFHGMALVDPMGPGPVPLYDPAYPGQMASARTASGAGDPPLDGRAAEFREAFRRDPALQVFHFLPLYFPSAGRTEVFQALLTLASTPEGTPRVSSSRTQFGLTALAAVLPLAGQRRLLGEFVSALEAEWRGFYRDYRRDRAASWHQVEAAVQNLWDGEFLEPLLPFLSQSRMLSGAVFLVPALGNEGRVFTGIPSRQDDNALAVSDPKPGEEARSVVYEMVRELSFSLARRALEGEAVATGGRTPSEDVIGHGAVQAGSMILEVLLSQEVAPYQRHFLSRAGITVSNTGEDSTAFHGAFPLEEGQRLALRDLVSKTITDGGES